MCSKGIGAKVTLEWLVSRSEEGWSQCWRIPRGRGQPSIMAATGPWSQPAAQQPHIPWSWCTAQEPLSTSGADVPPRSCCLVEPLSTLEPINHLGVNSTQPLHCWWSSWGQSVTTLLPSQSLGWSLWSYFPGHQHHFRLPKPCYPGHLQVVNYLFKH